jgi:hypothetical protein
MASKEPEGEEYGKLLIANSTFNGLGEIPCGWSHLLREDGEE